MADKQQTKSKKPATKAKKVGQSKENYKDVKVFTHPAETWWGKAVVWVIIFAMVGLVIVSFVLALINSQA